MLQALCLSILECLNNLGNDAIVARSSGSTASPSPSRREESRTNRCTSLHRHNYVYSKRALARRRHRRAEVSVHAHAVDATHPRLVRETRTYSKAERGEGAKFHAGRGDRDRRPEMRSPSFSPKRLRISSEQAWHSVMKW